MSALIDRLREAAKSGADVSLSAEDLRALLDEVTAIREMQYTFNTNPEHLVVLRHRRE